MNNSIQCFMCLSSCTSYEIMFILSPFRLFPLMKLPNMRLMWYVTVLFVCFCFSFCSFDKILTCSTSLYISVCLSLLSFSETTMTRKRLYKNSSRDQWSVSYSARRTGGKKVQWVCTLQYRRRERGGGGGSCLLVGVLNQYWIGSSGLIRFARQAAQRRRDWLSVLFFILNFVVQRFI